MDGNGKVEGSVQKMAKLDQTHQGRQNCHCRWDVETLIYQSTCPGLGSGTRLPTRIVGSTQGAEYRVQPQSVLRAACFPDHDLDHHPGLRLWS